MPVLKFPVDIFDSPAASPKKKAKKSTGLLPSSVPKDAPCVQDHTNPSEFNEYDLASYFTESYFASNPKWPRKCCGVSCGKTFVAKRTDEVGENEYRVSKKSAVHVCPKVQDGCNHAYCHDCYQALVNNMNNGSRKRKRAHNSSLMPGETLVDGRVVAI